MQIICDTTEFQLHASSAVAIGKFDGIHAGHFRLLDEILRQKQHGLQAVVFTFYPSATVYFGVGDGKELTTREEKRAIFERLGIDILVEFPLNAQTAAIEPERFVTEILLQKMKMKFVAAGADVTFGKGGKGNRELLEKFASRCPFTLQIIDKIYDKEREISSTYVREMIKAGNMERAAKLLMRPYSFCGVVESGRKLGRKLGFPTVNLYPPKEKLLPPKGVYYSVVLFDGGHYYGITNIGTKPTVQQEEEQNVETFLYDFDRDIYGKEIVLELLQFKRPEHRFENLQALKEQLRQDVKEGADWFEHHRKAISERMGDPSGN